MYNIPVLNYPGHTEHKEYFGISFDAAHTNILYGGEVYIKANKTGKCLVLYGMTLPDGRVHVGEKIAELSLRYADGDMVKYPLIIGESLWWGDRFVKYHEPFTSFADCKEKLWNSLKLYPEKPVTDSEGFILGIKLQSKELAEIEIICDTGYLPSIRAFTILDNIPDFLENKLLNDVNDIKRNKLISDIRNILYVSEENFPKTFKTELPENYKGPVFKFTGDKFAEFYTNVIHFNLDDSASKIDNDGYAHTSSLGAPWYGYDAIGGVYTPDGRIYPDQKPGHYYAECWTRDLGRSLIELIKFGRAENVAACLDWILNAIRKWETDENLLFEGKHKLPRHVQRILQRFETDIGNGSFENDGHAMVSIALWFYWSRLSTAEMRLEYAQARWEDIKALGDWYIWQFENPEISRATDILWSDTEASDWPFRVGASFYVDYLAKEALLALSEIADHIGYSDSATAWRTCANNLEKAIVNNYLGETEFGTTWYRNQGWAGQTNISHIILSCDRYSMNLKLNDPELYNYDVTAGKINKIHYRAAEAMGYIQAFTMQAALMLDEINTVTDYYHDCAYMIYNPVISPYLVPESSRMVCPNTYTRVGDLGNCVQQAEILKVLRLTVGIDDNCGLRFMSRIPIGWDSISVEDYSIWVENKLYNISYKYAIDNKQTTVSIKSNDILPEFSVRLGGYGESTIPSEVYINDIKTEYTIEYSGDRVWLWVNCKGSDDIIIRTK